VAEGIDAQAVGQLISHMHDRIMTQAWGLALLETLPAHGPAPARHAVCVLGSQARREQYLATAQDLALVWERPAAAPAHAGAVGFPPCPRRIMLDNPDWRRSVDSWLDLADGIAAKPEGEGVVTASLLADLRPLDAPALSDAQCCLPELGTALRRELDRRFRDSALLLKCMAREAVRFSPPLGLFRGFSPDKDGRLDLKRGGVFPVTQGAKALGLQHGLEQTGTLERLEALGRAGTLSRSLARGLCEGCALLQTLRMRAQAESLAQGETPGNTIRPDELGKIDAERLRAAFKLVGELQDLLSASFALHLMA
jgi:CBS domain-containing protein